MATGAASAEVLEAIAREVARMLQPRLVQIFRWEQDTSVTVVGTWGDGPNPFPAGSNWPWEDPSLVAIKEHLASGRPVRVENVAESLAGALADAGLSVGIGSAAGAPIFVAGEPWGHMSIEMASGLPLPDRVEEQLGELTELVATAIASSANREQLTRLADEQDALRRVATLVARGAPPDEVFDAVAKELGRLLDVASSGLVRFEEDDTARVVAGWGRLGEVVPIGARLPIGGNNVITKIARTGKPARLDDMDRSGSGAIADHAKRIKTRTAIGGPITVAGRLWGAMIAATVDHGSLPPDIERRLAQFIELVGTAIANTEARVELARLADEQAALRRVATLVAEEVPALELFAKVGEEVAGVLGPEIESAIFRYEGDETATVLAGSSDLVPGGIRVGLRLPLDGGSVTALVFREKRVVRVDDYAKAGGSIADHAGKHEITTAIGCPIVVKGRLWGSMVVAHREREPFPADTERRVMQFTELVATAIANAEARAQLQRLADEQAALRRVATLVAEASSAPTAVFDAAIAEVAQLLGASQVGMVRAESADECVVVAYRAPEPRILHVGMRLPLAGDSVTSRVLRSGGSARINLDEEGHGVIADLARRAHVSVTVAAPLTVEGELWGVITASWEGHDPPPGDAEQRLAQFAELLDTAIANADSRDQLTASRTRVLTAADEARRQVVRDLHDGAQQRLVHTIVTLKLAQRALDAEIDQARSLLGEALDHAETSNAELRELAHGILPSVLTHGGLGAGVDAVVSRMDVPVVAEITSARLPPEIEASAYFIVAEALTNVVKHSRATLAEVTVTVADGALRLKVRDDGVGGADPSGHGLLGIGDRAAALGGRLRLDSPRGGGTVLTADLPLSPG